MTEEQVRDGGLRGAVLCRATADVLQFQIHLLVSYACRVDLACSRCLNTYVQPVSGEFRVVLQDRNAPRSEAADEDEVDFFYAADDTEVDARQALYDEIMTALPLMPLCSPDCKGVETKTADTADRGADQDETIDPRWDALRMLKARKSQT